MVGLARFKVKAVTTSYWTPGEDFLERIVDAVRNVVRDGDIVVVSEKAVSTALGNLVDEGKVKPSKTACLIAKYWMRLVWGYLLGPLCRLKKRNIQRLRNYPVEEGCAHKEVVMRHTGFLRALMLWSEGGMDGSNLPYAYVSLPLRNAEEIAEEIRGHIRSRLGRSVAVMIIDTDKTYSFRNFHFTPRPSPIKGIRSVGGFAAYVIGRFLRLRRRATPLAVAGAKLDAETALKVANISNRAQESGAGLTVWDMAEAFNVPLTGVTWQMLNRVKHKPVVIVRLV